MAVNTFIARVIFGLSMALSPMAAADALSACGVAGYQNTMLTKQDVSTLHQHTVVFVEGLLNETAQKLGLGYFQPQKDFLDSIQVPYLVLKTSSELSEQENSQAVLLELQKIASQSQIILFTHSRGGVLALRALLQDKNLWPQISGWIAIQTPFGGTALADKIKSNKVYEKLGLFYLDAVGSNAQVFEELTTEQRMRFYSEQKENIKDLLSSLRVLTVGSEVEGFAPKQMGYYIHPTRGLAFPKGSDGVVSPGAAILRADEVESAHVVWSQVGHRDIVFPNKKRSAHPRLDLERVTEMLFKSLLLVANCGSSQDV